MTSLCKHSSFRMRPLVLAPGQIARPCPHASEGSRRKGSRWRQSLWPALALVPSFHTYRVPVGASLCVPPEMSQSSEDSPELTSTSQEARDATGRSSGVQLPLQAGGMEGFLGEVTPELILIKTWGGAFWVEGTECAGGPSGFWKWPCLGAPGL